MLTAAKPKLIIIYTLPSPSAPLPPAVQKNWEVFIAGVSAHVSSVGVAPPGGELPVELVGRASLFVETRDAFAPTPVGSCELDGIDPQTGTELGEMLLGLRPGRTSADQITVYKAMSPSSRSTPFS